MTKLILFTSLFFSASVFAELAIVVHPSNANQLSQKEVYKIFLGKSKEFPSGQNAIAFDQVEGQEVRTEFEANVLKKAPHQLKAYWSKQVFTGKGKPPEALYSDAEIIEKVKNNPNAIGYINKSNITADVKVINID